MNSLLIVSCSRYKRSTPGLLPAIERYDGSTFRLIRRFLRQKPSETLDILILSAQFGLISSCQEIPDYDQKMTRGRAQELQQSVLANLRKCIHERSYQRILVCVGQNYLQSLQGYEKLMPRNLDIQTAKGAMGKKLADLYEWLYGQPAASPKRFHLCRGSAYVQGVNLVLTPDEVIEQARSALREGKDGYDRYVSWYVPIDGQPVAPKWLVSQLTGLPVKAFTASDARRVLQQLGVQVLPVAEIA